VSEPPNYSGLKVNATLDPVHFGIQGTMRQQWVLRSTRHWDTEPWSDTVLMVIVGDEVILEVS